MSFLHFLRDLIYHIFGVYPKSPELHYVLTRDTKQPNRGTSLSAGIDVYIPNDYGDCVIKPNESVLIPTGIHVKFDPEYVLIAFNKSGIAAKRHLIVGAQVIDADYQGEIHVNLHNVGNTTQTLKPGDKITQFILQPVVLAEPIEVDNLSTLYDDEITERGTGGFGSTDKNSEVEAEDLNNIDFLNNRLKKQFNEILEDLVTHNRVDFKPSDETDNTYIIIGDKLSVSDVLDKVKLKNSILRHFVSMINANPSNYYDICDIYLGVINTDDIHLMIRYSSYGKMYS